MISDLPIYVYLTFLGAVLFSLTLFYRASNKNLKVILAIISWGILHSVIAISGFYENTKTVPPRFTLVIFPLLLIVFLSIFSSKIKNWLGTFNLKQLTFLHMVRIPVELVLLWLFLGKYVPELMTFEGRNFDVLIGLFAPIVALIAFRRNQINKKIVWLFNVLSILFLANILIIAVLSAPTAIQQFGFDQPNFAVIRFPFILLPTIIVPLVLISNIAGFIILSRMSHNEMKKS